MKLSTKIESNDTDEEFHDGDMLASIFEERAEHLSSQELIRWSAETPYDREVLSKLKSAGAKLLVGPRGSGKSTLLRKAYFSLIESDGVLPAYVNFAKSLALEPLFHRRADALNLFRQWVLYKVIGGTAEALRERQSELPADLASRAEFGEQFIHGLETGAVPDTISDDELVAPSQLLLLLEGWTADAGCKRCVLLLDDAAHAFSPEQQREFFEIFRNLRSRIVSAKAAVYPGITTYSPNFHVGHEAELVEAWSQPDSPEYLAVMRSIVEKRLPQTMQSKLLGRTELVDYLALASFGLPRGFITMLSRLLGVEEDQASRPSRKTADAAVSAHSETVIGIFLALAEKLPRFKNFIEVGNRVIANAAQVIRKFNYTTNRSERASALAIHQPVSPEFERILAFLEYAGIVRKLDTISRGRMGVYRRYAVHYAILLKENALSLGASYSIDSIVDALQKKSRHALAYVREGALMDEEERARCTLELPPCSRCGAERASEEARFCMRCGNELVDSSIYEELLKTPLSRLPLTQRKINDITQQTSLRTVQDVLLDDEMRQIRGVSYIGPVWASRIKNAAEEFVSV